MHKLLTSLQQTYREFEEEYWVKLNSSLNSKIKLNELVLDTLYPYSKQCHEATLTLAFALNNTLRGNAINVVLSAYCYQNSYLQSVTLCELRH